MDGDALLGVSNDQYAFRPDQAEGVLWDLSGETCGGPGTGTPNPLEFSSEAFGPLGKQIEIKGASGESVFWPAQDVRFFLKAAMSGLYEEVDRLPYFGLVVVLCSISDKQKLVDAGGSVIDGSGWKNAYLLRFENAENLWSIYPERRSMGVRRKDAIRLIGGIRCSSLADEYFPFALPRILVAPEYELALPLGGQIIEPRGGREQISESGCQVVITDVLDPPPVLSIVASRGLESATPKRIRIHSTKASMIGSGLSDGATDGGESSQVLWPDSCSSREPNWIEDVGVQMMAVLSVWGTCSYRRQSNMLHELLLTNSCSPARVVADLAAIGHIEISVHPETGRWSKIRVPRGVLRRLPWDVELESGCRRVQGVVVGSCDWLGLRRRLETIVEKLEVVVDITPQEGSCLPPRVRIIAADAEELSAAARALGLEYRHIPLSGEIADSVPRLMTSIGESQWHEGIVGPGSSVSYFSSFLMADAVGIGSVRLDQLKVLSDGELLATQKQSHGGLEYFLCDVSANRRVYLPANQRQTARWKCYVSDVQKYLKLVASQSGGSRPLDVPYLASTGTLLTPLALRPPAAVQQLLVGSSGLLPKIVHDGPVTEAICRLASGMSSKPPRFVFAKGSALLAFERVPRSVADLACQIISKMACDSSGSIAICEISHGGIKCVN